MEASLATIEDSYSLRRGPTKPPISTHPAFPAIVALWFAALLGLGSLVLPIALLERLVTVTGIAALVPSAEPPLGFTAHAGIALAGAIAGAAMGLLLARKIAQAHAVEPMARAFGAEKTRPRRPISAHDELGEEGLAPALDTAPPLLAQKRRSLAMAEDNRRSTYLEAAPLPGHSDNAPMDVAASAAEPHAVLPEPLELGAFSDLEALGEEQAPEFETDPALEALRSRIHTPVESTLQDQSMTNPNGFEPSNDQGDQRERQEFQPFPEPVPARDGAEPLPFTPPSLRRLEPVFEEEEDGDEADVRLGQEASAPQLSVVEFAEPDFGEAAVDAGRPLDELGLVQLAARLGASLKKRKALTAREPAIAAPALAPVAAAGDFEAAGAEDAARAIADFFSPHAPDEPGKEVDEREAREEAPAVPAPLRGFAVDADDEAEDAAIAASFSLPLGANRAPVASIADEEDVDDEAEEAEDEYSSLLAMKNPFARQQEFVRVEEPEIDGDAFEPTVTFPQSVSPALGKVTESPAGLSSRPFDPPRNPANSAAPAVVRDPGDAERSLRDALATLQRMSGAA
jgi:hypothetical protein